MRTRELETRLQSLSAESLLRFCAFYIDRMIHEAGLHPISRTQLKYLPSLQEARQLAWARTELDQAGDPEQLSVIVDHFSDHWLNNPLTPGVLYVFDVLLYNSAAVAKMFAIMLQDPKELDAWYVSHIPRHFTESLEVMYVDAERALAGEEEVLEYVLHKLLEADGTPFTRSLFEDLIDWPRGQATPTYRMGQVYGADLGE